MILIINSKIVKAVLTFAISNTQEARSRFFFSISFLLLKSTVQIASVHAETNRDFPYGWLEVRKQHFFNGKNGFTNLNSSCTIYSTLLIV